MGFRAKMCYNQGIGFPKGGDFLAENIFYRARRAAAALFTRRCVCCGRSFSGRQCVCSECAAGLVPADEPRGDFAACASYMYEGAARNVMLRFKFGDSPELCADTLADWLCDGFDRHFGGEAFDFVTSVPAFKATPRMELFVRDFAARRGLCYRPGLLTKIRSTKKQHSISAAERRTNLLGAFEASPAVWGKKILLTDDIFTTGSTVSECAGALLAAGAASVSVLTVLRAEDKTEKSDNRKEK